MVEERRVGLLKTASETLLVLRQVVPRLDARIARRQDGVGWNHPELLLAVEPALPHDIPSLVELTSVFGKELGRCLMWRVSGAEGQVHEERAIGPNADRIVDELDRFVDEIFRQVITVLGTTRRLDPMVVVHQFRMELVGFAIEKAVEAIEAALQRPLVERSGGRTLRHRAEMPLAECECRVPLVAEHFGHRGRMIGDVSAHVWEARIEI